MVSDQWSVVTLTTDHLLLPARRAHEVRSRGQGAVVGGQQQLEEARDGRDRHRADGGDLQIADVAIDGVALLERQPQRAADDERDNDGQDGAGQGVEDVEEPRPSPYPSPKGGGNRIPLRRGVRGGGCLLYTSRCV